MPEGGVALDPFMGGGATAIVTLGPGRKFVGIELDPTFVTTGVSIGVRYRRDLADG